MHQEPIPTALGRVRRSHNSTAKHAAAEGHAKQLKHSSKQMIDTLVIG